MDNELSIGQIADALGVNKWTVYRWIEWYFSNLPKPSGIYLPPYTLKGHSKMFKSSDLDHFRKFRADLPFGAMSEYTRYRFTKKPKDPKVREAISCSLDNQRAQMLTEKKVK